ncbi:type III secretion system export apparatus subunit SctT [Paraburkholderia bonniea]|uniref:type III secretion system export apparatus subunit SctT n=1 Tax=Paraburkholderia bonniea TaxID=2152891 RepID=UPI0012922816|nr:type III secretion system export apparatus subunit SctT [Paraburkholderia bonniea]WJF89303.1 type III secretion system export apparatus subunit SctT [Paraburkholderia bonniea]WJF92619.1 type III secretion system export apparatus subunit SctT [Paraburkholderia bonniea]
MSELDLPLMFGLPVKSLALGWLVALPRMTALWAVVPILTRQTFPGLLSLSVSAGFALLVAPSIARHISPDGIGVGLMMVLAVKELLLGLMLGFLLALPFWAVEALGFLIDNQRGESISGTLNPFDGQDTSTLGQLFHVAFIVYVFTSGSFTLLLGILYDSYIWWPPLAFWPKMALSDTTFWLANLNHMVEMMLLLASPVVLGMLFVELGLALISHFAPQLQVFFLAMPLKSALAFMVLAAYTPTMFEYVNRYIDEMTRALPHMSQMMGRL